MDNDDTEGASIGLLANADDDNFRGTVETSSDVGGGLQMHEKPLPEPLKITETTTEMKLRAPEPTKEKMTAMQKRRMKSRMAARRREKLAKIKDTHNKKKKKTLKGTRQRLIKESVTVHSNAADLELIPSADPQGTPPKDISGVNTDCVMEEVKESEEKVAKKVSVRNLEQTSQPSTSKDKHTKTPQNSKKAEILTEIRKLRTEIQHEISERRREQQNNAEKIKTVMELLLELSANWEQLKSVKETGGGGIRRLEDFDGPPPCGFLRKDNETIHIGQGIWIPKRQYDTVVFGAKTNSMFVRNMALVIFDIEELLTSSITGTRCNRLKTGAAKKPLDATKLLALKDIFRHYLEEKKCKEDEITCELESCAEYLRGKISDLSRAKKPKLPKNTNEPGTSKGQPEGIAQKEESAASSNSGDSSSSPNDDSD